MNMLSNPLSIASIAIAIFVAGIGIGILASPHLNSLRIDQRAAPTAQPSKEEIAEGAPDYESKMEAYNAAHSGDSIADTRQQKWTKEDFRKFVGTQTKAQIKAALGKPDNVDDVDDSWEYNDLPIYDAEAGTQAHLTYIRFSGLEGSQDFAVGVRFAD